MDLDPSTPSIFIHQLNVTTVNLSLCAVFKHLVKIIECARVIRGLVEVIIKSQRNGGVDPFHGVLYLTRQ